MIGRQYQRFKRSAAPWLNVLSKMKARCTRDEMELREHESGTSGTMSDVSADRCFVLALMQMIRLCGNMGKL